jgi:hypothetical protein
MGFANKRNKITVNMIVFIPDTMCKQLNNKYNIHKFTKYSATGSYSKPVTEIHKKTPWQPEGPWGNKNLRI